MTTHIARVLGLEPPTHYHRAFSSVGLCGEAGPHSLTPTCATCREMIAAEDTDDPTEIRLPPLNQWTAVPLPPDVETLLAQPIPSGPCLDGSTEKCVPAMPLGFDVPRCVYCRRELR